MDITSVSSIAGQKIPAIFHWLLGFFHPIFLLLLLLLFFIPRFLTEPCSGKRGRDQRMANTAHTAVSTYTRVNNV